MPEPSRADDAQKPVDDKRLAALLEEYAHGPFPFHVCVVMADAADRLRALSEAESLNCNEADQTNLWWVGRRGDTPRVIDGI